MKLLARLLFSFLFATTFSTVSFGQAGPGPGPVPNPWVVNGSTIYYTKGPILGGTSVKDPESLYYFYYPYVAGTSSTNQYSIRGQMNLSGSGTETHGQASLLGYTRVLDNGTWDFVRGVYSGVDVVDASTVMLGISLYNIFVNRGAAHVVEADGVYTHISNLSTGTIDAAYGINVVTPDNALGVITRYTGVRVADIATAGNISNTPVAFGSDGFNDRSYMAGSLMVGGTTAPSAKLEVSGTSRFDDNLILVAGKAVNAATGGSSIVLGSGYIETVNNVGLNTVPSYRLDVAGDINTTTVYRVGGTQIAASNLSNGVSGSGAVCLVTSCALTTPALGTPSAVALTNGTGLPLTTGVTGILPIANGGTGVSGNNIPYVLDQSGTSVSAGADTTEDTLATITLPSHALGANGCVDIQYMWSVTSSGNNKTLRFYLGGTGGTKYLEFLTSTNSTVSGVKTICAANSEASQFGAPVTSGGQQVNTNAAIVTSAVDLTSATTIVFTGQKTSSGETLTLVGYSITVKPHS